MANIDFSSIRKETGNTLSRHSGKLAILFFVAGAAFATKGLVASGNLTLLIPIAVGITGVIASFRQFQKRA